ncbi:Hint domain-containing homing endonuclease [Mucilaginibacter angelicae]|uniref:Hint domain-containing homing endonuclease n=1 Tax=Mucilaginibacter angelicae TaxID=869718 RepID=A0ABV6L6S8_9SPHI
MSQGIIKDDFASSANGWTVVTNPGAANPRQPVWSAGMISYTPAAEELDYSFLAPATYLGDQSKSYGCNFGFTLGYNIHPVTFKTSPLIVIEGGGNSIGLAMQVPAPTAANAYPLMAILNESAGWLALPANTAASAAEIQAVLQNVTQILIRADIINETFATVSLSAVSLAYVIVNDLSTTASIYYQGQKLYASWLPVANAWQYNITVTDETGTNVYSGSLQANSFSPPVTIGGGSWAPLAGKTYTVVVMAVGPGSDPVSVTTVDIGKAVLSIQQLAAGATFSWALLTGANSYDLHIQTEADPTVTVVSKENITSTPIVLTEADGLVIDVAYNGRLRGRAGNSFGDWSDPVPFTLNSARQILFDLQQRLNNNKPGASSVIFNDTTFPAGTGNPAGVLSIIKSAFSINDLTTTLTGTVALSADGLSLTLAGTTTLGTTLSTVNALFQVSNDLNLTLVLRLGLPNTWKFSDTFPTLKFAAPDYLYLEGNTIILSTNAYTDATVFYPLQTGLNYLGTMLYTQTLSSVPDPTDARVQIGGYITQDANGVSVNFNGKNTVSDLTATFIGLQALTFTGGQVSIISQAAAGALNSDTAVFKGSVALYERTLACNLDIPTKLNNKLSLRMTGSAGASIDSLTDAIAPVTYTSFDAYMPAALNSLAGLSVTAIEFEFDPTGAEATSAALSLSLDSGQAFDLIPSLVSIRNLVFSISANYTQLADQTISSAYSATISGTYTFGGLPVNISLFIPMQDNWVITIEPTAAGAATLNNIARFAGTTDTSILSSLPVFFQTLTSFSVDQIIFTAAIMPPVNDSGSDTPFTPSVTSVSFTLSQTSPWVIASDILSVTGWTLAMNLVKGNQGWDVSGVLNGNISLGSNESAVTFNINLPFPVSDQGWVIRLAGDGFDIPGLGDILGLVGASSLSNLLPQGIRNIGNIHVFAFEIAFDPTVASPIKTVFFQMGTDASQNWTLIENQGLVISNIETGITIVNDPGGVYAVGYIGGELTIAGTTVSVQSSRTSKDDPWLLDMTTVTVIHVPGLSSLANWMLPATVSQYIPVSMIPFSNGLDIIDAGMQFDLTNLTLNQISFVVINQETWSILQGFISADNLRVDATIDTPLATPGLTLHAEVLLNIGPVGILVAADKASPTADFIFSGTLDRPATIDFAGAFSSMSLTFTMPYDYGFPRSMILETASVTLNYTKGNFNFAATSTFDWSFNFGFTTLNILAINLAIEIATADSTGSHPYNLKAGGTLTLAGMQAVLNFTASNIPSQDTILTASVTPGQVANISIENTVNTLVTTDTQGKKWNTVIPSGYTAPSFSSAYIHVNLSQKIFYLYGAAIGLGGIAIIAKKIDEQNWGYALGLNLGSDFKFANIFSALSAIDDYLKVNSAGLFVVSYTGSTTTLAQDISAIDAFPDKPAGIPSILPVSNIPAISMTSGMMFYGDLNITTSGLFNKLVQIGADGTAQIIIYGFINNTNPTQTIFIADLPDIVLFNTLKFTHQDAYTGIHLTYSPGNNNQFQLAARLVITVFGTDYSFDGNLAVNNTLLDATIALVTGSPNNQIVNPFGVPGITIGSLYAQVNYTFGHDAIPAQGANPAVPATETTSSFTVGGTVLIGPAPAQGSPDNRLACSAKLALLQSMPVLATIQLISNFSVADFFTQCITGSGASWPTGLINITFLTGSRIYYYDATSDTSHTFLTDGDYTYRNGFNIDAAIKLTIIIDIDIAFTLRAIEDGSAGGNSPKTYKGVIATGSLLSGPIELYVLEIAGTTTNANGNYTGAPVFKLDTTTSPGPAMGFAAGFNFFKKPFGTADLSITKNNAGDLLLTGTLASAVSFDPFGVLSLGFTYSASNGFNITGWPSFDFAREAIDFVKTLQAIASAAQSGGLCSKLANFVVANAYTTKFTINPSFLTQSGGFYLSISGTYQLSVLGNAFLTANFPNAIQIPLPNSLSLDDLPGEIFSALAGAATSFVNALLANPEAIAKFLVIVAGENAAGYAADIICNGLADAVIDAAVAAGLDALATAGGIVAGGAAAIAAAATAILSILSSCFTAGTKVLMADGNTKNIEDIIVGDVLLGAGAVHNKVVSLDSPKLGNRKLYAINKGRHFVTEEHPFMTREGWKSINPAATLKENENLTVGALGTGDMLILAGGEEIVVESIESLEANPETQLYNFILEGDNTYYADGFLVHNKGGDSCFVAGTLVLMGDGSEKPIQDILVGDSLIGKEGVLNKVLDYDSPLLGNRLLYSFNDGPFFVTEEHPFLTEDGWKSLNPAATARENPDLLVKQLIIGDVLILADGRRKPLNNIQFQTADPETQLYNFILEGNNTYYADGHLAHNKGSSCFVANTLVLMDDGSEKPIQDILVGDSLIGEEGVLNKVLDYDSPLLGNRLLYSFNDGPFFVTEEHPFLTADGWKSLNPAATAMENPDLPVKQLAVGDLLIMANGVPQRLDNIQNVEADPETQLYNFILEGNNTYYADGHLVHNKGGGSCFVANTLVLMGDGSEKPIQDILVGDSLIGEEGVLNKVLDYDSPLLGNRLLYSFNDGPFFVTEEHPFLTEDGWKSLNPAATARENPDLPIKQLIIGDVLILADGRRKPLNNIQILKADPETQLYNFILEGNNTYYADGHLVHNKGGGSSCFVADTFVLMHDQSKKPIQNIRIGDLLIGEEGILNKVLDYDSPSLGDRLLYSFNGGPFFVTEEHPFLTADGWKSLNPKATARENPDLPVKQLAVGDLLIMANGVRQRLDNIQNVEADPETQLYNFILEGNNTYYADGYLVHNKGGGTANNPAPPDFDTVTFANGILSITWDSAAYADKYDFQFLKPDQSLLGTMTSIPYSNQKSVTVDLSDESLPSGSYTAQLRSDSGSFSSAWNSYAVTKPDAPGNIALGYSSSDEKLNITWSAVGSQTTYIVILLLDNAVNQTQPASQSTLSYDAGTLPAGTYSAKVQTAIVDATNNYYIPGIYGLSQAAIVKPAAPTNPQIGAGGDQINITWDALDAGLGYQINLLKDGQLFQSAESNATNVSFDASAYDTGAYTAQIRLKGDASHLPSDYAVTAQSISRLSAPQDITFSYTDAATGFTVGWSAVTGNNGYAIRIVDQLTKAVIAATTNVAVDIITLNIPLSSFIPGAGPYIAEVKAIGVSGTLDSAFGESTQSVNALATPQGVTFSYDESAGFTVGWSAVTGNNGYTIRIVDQLTKAVIAATANVAVNIVTLNIPLSSFTPGAGPYIAEVKAIGASGTLDSTFGESAQSVNVLATPHDVTFSYDASAGFTVAWGNVSGNNGYAIRIVDQLTKAVMAAVASAAVDAITINIPLSSFTPGTGPYIAEVKAQGAAGAADSAFGQSAQSISQMAPPQITSFVYDNIAGLFTITWNAVTANNGYNIQIIDNQTKLPVADPVSTPADSTKIDISDSHLPGGGGTFIAQVKTIGTRGVLDSAFAHLSLDFYDQQYLQFQGNTFGEVLYNDPNYKSPGVDYTDSANPYTLYNLMNDGFAIEAMVYINPNAPGYNPILTSYITDSTLLKDGYSLCLSIENGKFKFAMTTYTWNSGVPSNPQLTTVTSSDEIPTGQWVNLAVTHSYQGQVFLYVNGNKAGSFYPFYASIPGFRHYFLGKEGNTFFAGMIREVRIWRLVYLQSDISSDISSRLAPLTKDEIPLLKTKGLGAYWPLTDGQASTADLINNNNFALSNPEWVNAPSQLASPQDIVLSYGTTAFTISWGTVTGNNGYAVRIVDQQTKAVVAASANAAANATSVNIPMSSFSGAPGAYVIQVKTLGAPGTADSIYGELSININPQSNMKPIVLTMAYANVPAIPQGMKYECTAGPDSLNTINNCPVVNWLGYTFWAFSYIDNRNSFGIAGYDSNGNVVAQWEKPGSRYLYKITIDEIAKSVTFWGQANQTVVMTWDELNIHRLHYWGFDETSGLIAFDTPGTINGNLTPSVTRETPGCVGPGALHIDGSNGSYVSFGTSLGQFGTNDFTVALWFKTTETIRLFDLAGNRTDSSDGVFFCIRMTGVHETLPEGVVTIEVDENGGNYIYVQSQAQNLNNGQWHHIAAVRQGTHLQLYIDGALNSDAVGGGITNIINGNDFRIGRSLVMDVDRFAPNASFDELYVCETAISADQIIVLYNQKAR